MALIKDIKAREILDSRGDPTIEVDVICDDGSMGRTSIPSGASTGSKEALELRDNNHRYMGKGVLKAVSNVESLIKPRLIDMDVSKQKEIDNLLISIDATENKSYLGANAMLGVSLSCLKASAIVNNQPLYKYLGNGETLPIPMMNILNGGAHADNNLDFQEFMIVPSAPTFKERLRIGAEVFHTLEKILKNNGYNTNVGNEGGFAPDLRSNTEGLGLLMEAIVKAGYKPGMDVSIAIDVAATQFYDQHTKKYTFKGENKTFTTEELINFYEQLINTYPIISIEDALTEDDFEGFKLLTQRLGSKVQLVGDDLFVTNKKLLQKGIDMQVCNSILIKLNQIGTVSEALDTITLAKRNGYKTIISHRSGETEDTFITDFAVGLNLGQIKTGSLSRTDRTCKYNQLLRIEEMLKK